MSAVQDGYEIFPVVFDAAWLGMIEPLLGSEPRACIAAAMIHPSVIEIATDLIGAPLARTGEENVNFMPTGHVYDAWHYDTPWDSHDGGIIPLWRFAVYFRDYTTHGGGLGIQPKTHIGSIKTAILQHYPDVVVQSRPGDLVVWNLRTHHRGDMPNGDLPRATPRNAIFFDYGKPGSELDRYVQWRKETRK